MSGAFLLHKLPGNSSNEVLQQFKRFIINKKWITREVKIGHAGTLDPFASGLLVVLIGEGTKLSDVYLHSKKTYTGTIQLGTQTDSGDLTGTPIFTSSIPHKSKESWQILADEFVKTPYYQTPPMHSAKKKDGTPLYELAHKGLEIERSAILKQIEEFKITPHSTQHDKLHFEVTCESGTYVRVLAEDLAKKANTHAHLIELCRTQSSDLLLKDAMTLQDCEALPIEKHLLDLKSFIPLTQMATHIPTLTVGREESRAIKQGNTRYTQPLCTQADHTYSESSYVVIRNQDENGALVALLEKGSNPQFRVQRVFQ